MKLTKTALNKFIKWTTSRYNEQSKPRAVQFAYNLLSGKRTDYETTVLECGSYTPSSDMGAGGSYFINVPEQYIARVRANWNGDKREWDILQEYERLEFGTHTYHCPTCKELTVNGKCENGCCDTPI